MKNSLIRKITGAALAGILVFTTAACGSGEVADSNSMFETVEGSKKEETPQKEEPAVVEEEQPAEEEIPQEIPEGMYASELTGLPISEDLKNLRPIAAMVDNEIKALPHFGTAQTDIVFELMNSTANDRITRLMCVVKDYDSIDQLGSIRSTRPTNIMLAAEFNAVLCHDGGPFHNDAYFAKGFCDHFSGTFSRVNNGKDREFTEYILPGDLDNASNFGAGKVSKEYEEGFSGDTPHFNFTEYGTQVHLDQVYERTYEVQRIRLDDVFKHNQSRLVYNQDTACYEYQEYGEPHLDEDSGDPLSFKNVFLLNCDFNKLDSEGYLVYNCLTGANLGFYITNGYAKTISWNKLSDQEFLKFFDDSGNPLTINRGKTYISLIPSDTWDNVVLDQLIED
ncbi:MAG: DUF3048 domain-containing protein [Lachnospiraceae bacterium]|nr:DUF3048 domain-containing protein [Lachnospiraceae bacterium]